MTCETGVGRKQTPVWDWWIIPVMTFGRNRGMSDCTKINTEILHFVQDDFFPPPDTQLPSTRFLRQATNFDNRRWINQHGQE